MLVIHHNHYHYLCHHLHDHHQVMTQAMMEVVMYNEVTDDYDEVTDEAMTQHTKDSKEEPKAVYGGHKHPLELP